MASIPPRPHTLWIRIYLVGVAPVCAARVLGFGLLYSTSDIGLDTLATDILGCDDSHELLAGLAHWYVFGFVKLCRLSVAFHLLSC